MASHVSPILSILISISISLSICSADRPLIIAHRGSCGMMPEHTVEGYTLAVQQGADFIECDLAITKDLQLICLHEAWINHTSDVSSHPEFNDRIRTYDVPGFGNITDYFSVDFTLAEIKTLKKIQQLPFRDQRYNGKYELATFDEYVKVAKSGKVGIYPEIKDPKFFNQFLNGTRVEDLALEGLKKNGYTKNSDACIIQSFDEDALLYIRDNTALRLMMLTENAMPTDAQIDAWSKYIYAVGPSKNQLIPQIPSVDGSKKMKLSDPTDLVTKIHKKGMKIHAYTFRNEDEYLAVDYGQDPYAEYEKFESLGVDAFFTDFAASMHRYIQNTQPRGGASAVMPSILVGLAGILVVVMRLQ